MAEFSEEVPGVIFISDVYLSDIKSIDTIFENLLLEPDICAMDKIPPQFKGLRSWIKKTNLKCWYCDEQFDTIPLFMPTSIEKSADGIIMATEGNFHSFECIYSYINLQYTNPSKSKNYRDMTAELYKILNDGASRSITTAPSKYLKECYGGELTQAQYEDHRIARSSAHAKATMP